jgi:hypothetical protein
MAIATKLEDTSTQLALFTEDQSLVQGILFVSRMTRREIAIGYINIFRFRHVGDFGNVEAIENQGINAMFTDSLATLMTGPNSILHRTLAVTEI